MSCSIFVAPSRRSSDISDGKLHDVNALDDLLIEAGAFYVMDRGYLDFTRLYALHSQRAFFVIRPKRGMI